MVLWRTWRAPALYPRLIITSTTHKSLRGPRGDMVLCEEDLAGPD